jgi:hypothetical protein
MKVISFVLILLFLTPLYICAQETGKPVVKVILPDNSNIIIENHQSVPLSQNDIEQIVQASKNIKKQKNQVNKGVGIDSENYRRQLETDLKTEQMRLKGAKESYRGEVQKEIYELRKQKTQESIERDKVRTQRLREGKDLNINIFNE